MREIKKLSLNRHKSLRKLQKRKYRIESGFYLCEGWRLFNTALSGHAELISEVVVSDHFLASPLGDLFFNAVRPGNFEICRTTEKDMLTLSSEISPQGILFTMPLPPPKDAGSLPAAGASAMLYLMEISDPGNLGTIIRTAVWFGIDHIILSKGSVDPYNPKTVRSSAGALFDAEIYENVGFQDLRKKLAAGNYQFVATTPRDGKDLSFWKPSAGSVIMFGPEAAGLPEPLISEADIRITIPRTGPAESLNLAVSAGIVLYHFTLHTKQ